MLEKALHPHFQNEFVEKLYNMEEIWSQEVFTS